jgi:Flp pilus assembly pilin Flp
MEKIFYVDGLKKANIQKKYIKTSKGATALSIGLLATFIIFTIVFAVYGFGNENTFLVRDVTASDYGEKNLFFVWTVLITVDIIILFLWVIQKIAVNGILGKYINQRMNESLVISDEVIEYGYQNSVGSTAGDRVIVKVPVDNIRQIKIDRSIARIELIGLISSKYYENYSRRETRAPKNNYKESSFVIFDYFEPELIEFCENHYAQKVNLPV